MFNYKSFKPNTLILLCMLCLSLPACVSFTTHQTGRTLGLGRSSASISLQGGSLEGDSLNLPLLNEKSFILGEYTTMLGVHKKVDVGVKINTSFLIGGCAKWQIIGNSDSRFASSMGLEAMISPPFFHVAFGSSLTSYNSFHSKNDRIAFTVAPKYTLITYAEYADSTIRPNHLLGYSLGVMMGKKNKLSISFAQGATNEVSNIFRTAQFSISYVLYAPNKRFFLWK